jgi:hypothetical protein
MIDMIDTNYNIALWQYHDYILQFDGNGNWKFEELNSNLGILK